MICVKKHPPNSTQAKHKNRAETRKKSAPGRIFPARRCLFLSDSFPVWVTAWVGSERSQKRPTISQRIKEKFLISFEIRNFFSRDYWTRTSDLLRVNIHRRGENHRFSGILGDLGKNRRPVCSVIPAPFQPFRTGNGSRFGSAIFQLSNGPAAPSRQFIQPATDEFGEHLLKGVPSLILFPAHSLIHCK